MKLAGGSKTDEMSLDAFREQARDYHSSDELVDSALKVGSLLFRSHPFSVSRLVELEKWVESGDYRRIIEGDYPARGAEESASFTDDAAESARSYMRDIESSEDSLLNFLQDMQSMGGNAWDNVKSFFKPK